ncbi:unnamed protein product [Darwinula stevensoni]|uniref:DUF4772 domain-containing protein n=1 Tax=Darwinula stevensoni TaxID=69355 RepID=A0A7R8X9M0_9CRUS|nr:unnamed protein product [Darwinula stevensoni]CAG0891217.1 unnamed protein product [Darwinula stevensoni]
MSSSPVAKRFAKRAVLGARVAVPEGPFYRQATILRYVDEPGGLFTVKLEDSAVVKDVHESVILGPGFNPVSSALLRPGQRVFFTHNNREVTGLVKQLLANDEVLISLQSEHRNSPTEVKRRAEEIRFVESRKSARLQDSELDFAKLADMTSSSSSSPGGRSPPRSKDHAGRIHSVRILRMPGVVETEGRRDEGLGCDGPRRNLVPRLPDSDDAQSRTGPASPHRSERREFQLVLVASWESRTSNLRGYSQSWADRLSPSSTSSLGSAGTNGMAPDGPASPHTPSDEGIVIEDGIVEMDESMIKVGSRSRSHGNRRNAGLYFRTTVVRVGEAIEEPLRRRCQPPTGGRRFAPAFQFDEDGIPVHVAGMRRHDVVVPRHRDARQGRPPRVSRRRAFRVKTLASRRGDEPVRPARRGKDGENTDHEEEFYYNEVEVTVSGGGVMGGAMGGTTTTSSPPTLSHMDMARPPHENPEYQRERPVAAAVPISIPLLSRSWHHPYYASSGSPVSPQKYMRLSPKSSSPKISILRPRVRGETKKCRKVYGVENRDLWCTQCKWKKACSRFTD